MLDKWSFRILNINHSRSTIVLASAAALPVAQPSWYEHVDLMQFVIVALAIIAVWGLRRTLSKIDANQTRLFEMYDDLQGRLSSLEGEHKQAMRGRGHQEEGQ